MCKKPIRYNNAIAKKICQKIRSGVPLKVACRLDGMPHFSVVYYWIDRHPSFAKRYAEATRLGAQAIAEEIHEIGLMAKNDAISAKQANAAVNALKWSAMVRNPQKYSERVQQEITNKEDLTQLSEAELDRRLDEIFSRRKD